MRRERLLLALVLSFAAVLFVFRLGAGSFWDVDEPRYTEAGRELLVSGHLLTPHLNGAPWLGPAPLWLWLQAGSGALLGFSEWSARVWGAAFGVLGVAATFGLGREWFGPRTGLLSALILATTLAYAVTSRLAVLDTAAVTWMLLALWAGYRGYRDHRRREYVLAGLFMALGVLTRGPGTAAVPILVFVLFLAYRRGFGRLREVPWPAAAAVFLAVAAPWYAVEAGRSGGAFLRAAVWGHAASRLAAPPAAHAAAFVTGIGVLAIGAVPWTAFLPGAAAYHYLRRWQDGSLLCLLWGGLVLLLAVAVGEGVPADVLPAFPVAAIAVGRLWEEFLFEGAGRLGRTLATSFALQIGVVVLLVVAAATFATARYPREFAAVRDFLLAPVGALVLGTGVTTVLFRLRRYTAAFLSLPATTAVFLGILYTGTLPAVETQKPIKPLAAALRPRLRPGDRVVAYMVEAPAALVFYSRHLVEQAGDPAALRRDLCAPGRAFLVARRDDLAGVAGLPPGLEPVDGYGPYVLEVKPAGPACRSGS
ncbi:MAG TPA: glycosyltransferase family 39 protein [bacterium]|nr:glycosyltransferase family 39 protein [bacterium]